MANLESCTFTPELLPKIAETVGGTFNGGFRKDLDNLHSVAIADNAYEGHTMMTLYGDSDGTKYPIAEANLDGTTVDLLPDGVIFTKPGTPGSLGRFSKITRDTVVVNGYKIET